MKAMALPLLASHLHIHYCKTNKMKLIAIQANTGDLATVADTCVYWTQR